MNKKLSKKKIEAAKNSDLWTPLSNRQSAQLQGGKGVISELASSDGIGTSPGLLSTSVVLLFANPFA